MEIKPLDYCSETLKLRKMLEVGFLSMGERLHNIREKELWQGKWESYTEFLNEMNVTESTASKLVTVYNHYTGISPQKLAEAGLDKLYTAVPLLEEKTKSEVVDQAILYKRDDLRKIVKGQDECKRHVWGDARYGRCQNCNAFERV